MLEQYDLLVDVAELLDDLLEPDEAVDDPDVVSLVLGLLDALNERDEALVQVAKTEVDIA